MLTGLVDHLAGSQKRHPEACAEMAARYFVGTPVAEVVN
jgi:hypothetical protein